MTQPAPRLSRQDATGVVEGVGVDQFRHIDVFGTTCQSKLLRHGSDPLLHESFEMLGRFPNVDDRDAAAVLFAGVRDESIGSAGPHDGRVGLLVELSIDIREVGCYDYGHVVCVLGSEGSPTSGRLDAHPVGFGAVAEACKLTE